MHVQAALFLLLCTTAAKKRPPRKLPPLRGGEKTTAKSLEKVARGFDLARGELELDALERSEKAKEQKLRDDWLRYTRFLRGRNWYDTLLTIVAPTIGAALANAMFLSSLPAVLDARKAEDLGTLNPVPWAFILANCVGWLHYSFVTNNKYVFWSNAPGAVLGTFFTLTAVGLGTADQRRQIEAVVVCSAGVHVAAAFLTRFSLTSEDAKRWTAGLVANFILLFYYAAPLSTLSAVLRTRDASSILAPLAALNGLNGLLWVSYGAALQEPLVWAPNAVGVLLALVQLGLKGLLGARAPSKAVQGT